MSINIVPVREPSDQDFVRVHPDEAYRLTATILDDKYEPEVYLVLPHVAHQLPGKCSPAVLYTAINRQGVTFLWPVKLSTPDGNANEWHRSAAEAAVRAMACWLRVKADKALGGYAIYEASSTIPDPTWPTETLEELLQIGFRGRLVDSLKHPVIKDLRREDLRRARRPNWTS